MSKGGYITGGLYKIKDQLADPVAEPAGGTPEKPTERVSVLDKLSEASRQAWLERRQEYERVRQDLRFRLREFSARIDREEAENRKAGEDLQSVCGQLTPLTERVENQAEPDEFSEDFQMVLAKNIRELDQIRLELIDLQARIPAPAAQTETKSGNLFSDLDSVSFGQLFRIGAGLFLPLILTILFGAVLIGITVILTFRVGL
ncbi:MAG: hypothetical protein IJS14_04040 [Lentisphaeria bacterium]|nr:hypothetical protein [Lentisphaeria bacterium]